MVNEHHRPASNGAKTDRVSISSWPSVTVGALVLPGGIGCVSK